MSIYYCHSCALKLGHYVPPGDPNTLNLTGSAYLLRKFMEHTDPVWGSGKALSSIYSDPAYETYKNYYVSGSASGSLEIQPNGNKNLIWYAGMPLGPSYGNSGIQFTGDAVKIVFVENTGKLHHFHVDANSYVTAVCANCGCPILR